MKTLLIPTVVLGALLAGCGDSSNKSGSSPVTAPVDYLNEATKAQQKAVKVVDVTALNEAIQMFNVQEGRLPKDLNELVAKKYIPKIPEAPHGSKFVYDASTGTVKVE